MKFTDIANRLTGISCPVFGISWQPPELERNVARRLIAYLEDRRVLYRPSAMEVPQHCISSIIEIRHYLTQELQSCQENDALSEGLRAMRAACRKCLDTIDSDHDIILECGSSLNHWANWKYMGSVGELRGVFGIHVARIASQYGIDVEDELASILPGKEDNPVKVGRGRLKQLDSETN